jgi:thiol:disulfide interchange protein DsbC
MVDFKGSRAFARYPRLLLLLAACLWVSGGTRAAPEATKPDVKADIAHRLEVPLEAVRAAPGGLFEVVKGDDVVYVTSDGRYAVAGFLYDIDQRINVTRSALIGSLHDDDVIVFGPKNAPYTVTVFTDVDCQYCRKFHTQIAEYNRRGIRVRYVFYPRSGPGTESWRKAEAVWCSPDRAAALTQAKLGAAVPRSTLCKTHVAETFQLGNRLGIRGTPGIYSGHGDFISGYLSPDELLARLKELAGSG